MPISNYRKWLLAATVVILLVSVMSHMSALRNFYVLDDFKLIVGNDFITRWENAAILADPRHLLKPYPLRCGARPLTVFSLMVDYRLWKLNPFGYHLTNILLHAANGILLFFAALLVFRSLRSRGKKSSDKLAVASALLAALVFTLHPLQAEAVNIASFRADLLATLFSLLSLLLFMIASGSPDRRLYAGAAAAFALALFSKEIAISIPLVFLLYLLLLPKPAVSRQQLANILAFGAVAALFMTFFWSSRYEYRGFAAIYPNIVNNVSPLSSAAAYVNTLLHAFLHYVRTLLVPVNLSIDYQVQVLPPQSVVNGANLLSLLLLAGCGALFSFTRDRRLKFGLGFFFLTYLPVSNIIPLINTVNDRYMYLPMAGFSIIVATAAGALPELKPRRWLSLRVAVAFVLLCLYGSATLHRNPVFRDGYSLYHDAVRTVPANVRARYNYAIALMVNARYGEALQELMAVERLHPLYKRSDLWYLKGECYLNMGEYDSAKEYYRKSLLIKPDKDVLMRYAALLAWEGNARGAVSLLEQGTLFLPNAPDLYNALGTYYGQERQFARAINNIKKAIELDPDYDKAWFNMLLTYRHGNKAMPSRDVDKMVEYFVRKGWQVEEK